MEINRSGKGWTFFRETTILIQIQINSYHQTDFSRHWGTLKELLGCGGGGQERLKGKDTLLVLFVPWLSSSLFNLARA